MTIFTKEISYNDGLVTCSGYFAIDEKSHTSQKPVIMIAPDWRGRSEHVCSIAKALASLGYASFVIDVYGDAKFGNNPEECTALMIPFMENRNNLAKRMLAAFNAVKKLPEINPQQIAIIGYCFGGLCALDLARTGADVKAAVSFHGLLFKAPDAPKMPISAKILVLHGFDDPMVPPEQVLNFAEEMTEAQVDWQIHAYGLTTHAFTNPLANDPAIGLQYNQNADHRSWISMMNFLEELNWL